MNNEIIAYCCEHSAYTAADIAGREGLRYPEALRIIRVPCAGRVDAVHILKAFERGARAVMVMGCEDGACHHINGNERARRRVDYAKGLLKEVGINGHSVAMFTLAPNAPQKFVQAVDSMAKGSKESGEKP